MQEGLADASSSSSLAASRPPPSGLLLHSLPEECLLHLLMQPSANLSVEDIVRVAMTCRTLRAVCSTDSLWRSSCCNLPPLNIILSSLNPECHVNLQLEREEEQGSSAASQSSRATQGKWLEACKLARHLPALPQGVQLPVRRPEDSYPGEDFHVNDHCSVIDGVERESDGQTRTNETQRNEAAPSRSPGTPERVPRR
jgi:hypothetical protein